jgi:hypothetical protein
MAANKNGLAGIDMILVIIPPKLIAQNLYADGAENSQF